MRCSQLPSPSCTPGGSLTSLTIPQTISSIREMICRNLPHYETRLRPEKIKYAGGLVSYSLQISGSELPGVGHIESTTSIETRRLTIRAGIEYCHVCSSPTSICNGRKRHSYNADRPFDEKKTSHVSNTGFRQYSVSQLNSSQPLQRTNLTAQCQIDVLNMTSA